jgi:hypothetical protein
LESEESFGGRMTIDFADGPLEGIVVGHIEDTSNSLIALCRVRHATRLIHCPERSLRTLGKIAGPRGRILLDEEK